MYCNICGNGNIDENINIFKVYICKKCLSEIQTLKYEDENYDYYKNLIRIVLSHYISPPMKLNPVN